MVDILTFMDKMPNIYLFLKVTISKMEPMYLEFSPKSSHGYSKSKKMAPKISSKIRKIKAHRFYKNDLF